MSTFNNNSASIRLEDSEIIEIPINNIENKTVRKIMFRLNSKQAIKLSKGDTIDFSLFLNKGSIMEPIRYSFLKERLTVSTMTSLKISANLEKWKTSGITKGDLYSFTFYNGYWYITYEGAQPEIADLTNYGISVEGTPEDNDVFTVDYQTPDDGFVVFYVLPINHGRDYLLKKIIKSNGEIISKRNIRGEIITDISTGNENVDDEGNMIIKLEAEDSSFMPEGEFRYEIKAYIKSEGDSEYSVNTVTNRLPFYVIDNDYSSNFIYR